MDTIVQNLISVLIDVSVPLLVGYIVRKGSLLLNRQIDAKVEELKLKQSSQAQIDAYNSLKIEQDEMKQFEDWVKKGIFLAEEVAHKTWLDPSVKEKTGTEKMDIAKSYIIDRINTSITDPEKKEKFKNILSKEIEAVIPVLRNELDSQFNSLKMSYVKKNHKVPALSRDPRGLVNGLEVYSDGI